MRMMRYRAFLASLAITLVCKVRSQAAITCTAGYYKLGDKATITCHYHGEVNTATISKAYIEWHELGGRDLSTGKEVVMCHFNGGALQACDREKGYSFVNVHNSNLTIAVNEVSTEFQGRYSCGVVTPPGVSAPGRKLHSCLLVVEGATKPDNDVQKSPEKHESLHMHVQATLTLLIIIIIAAAGAIVFVILARRNAWFPFRKPDTPRPEENINMLPLDENISTEKQSVKQDSEVDGHASITTPQNPSSSVESVSHAVVDDTQHGISGQEKSEARKSVKKSVLKEQRQEILHKRLEKASSDADKTRIRKEFMDMLHHSRHGVPPEEKNGIQEEYVETMTLLNEDVSEVEKQRIQDEYDKKKTKWNTSGKG